MTEKKIELVDVKSASVWATKRLGKNVTPSNISYLIQYGRVKKYEENGNSLICVHELESYYNANSNRESAWKEQLGSDLNWALSFEKYKEAETTKHVHRLHPYKGKFIPQLVEYFLDNHTDSFKTETFFKPDDIILDPFAGSGTTLVQANELGMNAIGIDVSEFNSLLANVKISTYDFLVLQHFIEKITIALNEQVAKSGITDFENELLSALYEFNAEYFPVPEYKYNLHNKLIDEKKYSKEKEVLFLPKYFELVKKYHIQTAQKNQNSFLDTWFMQNIRAEIDFVYSHIQKIPGETIKNALMVILSRTMRSCRATTHADLATIIEPVMTTYYCAKHGKMCKPLFSIKKWWQTYSTDTLKRLQQFDALRTQTFQTGLTGDSRTIDIFSALHKKNPAFAELAKKQKIAGIFSSPPYVGLIDYHEQHAYAYDLFDFKRQDDLEIGPLFKGQGKDAKESYVQGISAVLNNCKQFFAPNYNVFLVANDKYSLYPTIAEFGGMKIVNQYKRPVLNRTEKDKGAYSEIIFHLKERE